jgi:hypothetical protein
VIKVKQIVSCVLCVVLILLTTAYSGHDASAQKIIRQPIQNVHVTAPPVHIEQTGKVVDTDPTPHYYNINLSHDLQRYTYETCVKYEVSDAYPLMLAVMWQESNFNANEISSTNDYGLMQINKQNHEWLSKQLGITDFLDAKQSILAGVYCYSCLLKKYDDYTHCLMAYNLGETGAARALRQGVTSTHYSRSVLDKLEQLKNL